MTEKKVRLSAKLYITSRSQRQDGNMCSSCLYNYLENFKDNFLFVYLGYHVIAREDSQCGSQFLLGQLKFKLLLVKYTINIDLTAQVYYCQLRDK